MAVRRTTYRNPKHHDATLEEIAAALKKIAARTINNLWDAIADVLQTITSSDCRNFFINAGYAPTWSKDALTCARIQVVTM